MENRSEVACLLRQIDEAYEAAERGLSGLAAGTARHDFIEAKMEHIGLCHQQLQQLLGEQAAMQLLYEPASNAKGGA